MSPGGRAPGARNLRDVVIIGGGHNGLVCAAYLAAAGLTVTVLERRHVVGGAAVTEEFVPGFRDSVAGYGVSLLNPTIVRDLDLAAQGLRIVARRLQSFVPVDEHRHLKLGAGMTRQEVAKFSARDVARLDAFEQRQAALAAGMRELVLRAPPDLEGPGWRERLPGGIRSALWGRRVPQLGAAMRRDLRASLATSSGELLDSWFECAPLKAALGFVALAGSYASPYAAGSGYGLLHHGFGETLGIRGAWGHAIGGVGAITQAMARAAERRGAEIRLCAGVREITLSRGRAVGVVTDRGEHFGAHCVIANVGPHQLYSTLVDPEALEPAFLQRVRDWRCGSGTFHVNVALSELPDFSALPGRSRGDHHTAGILLGPSLAYQDAAHGDAVRFGWSRRPIVHMLIPSTLDGSLAPPGRHVASLFCQHVAPVLPDGSSWDQQRDVVTELMLDTVNSHAPNFRASVLGVRALTPLDLERIFGLTGGDIFHGAMTRDQLFASRPAPGHAHYRSPVRSLYLCGAAAHPGGGITGAPGYNCANAVLADLRLRRFSRRLGLPV